MKTIIAAMLVLATIVSAQSQNYDRSNQGVNPNRGGRFNIGPIIPILRDDRTGPVDGHYSFEFETGNGIRRQEQGSPSGPNGAVVSQGAWSFTFPDGTPAEFSFVADENGYRVDSPLLPTPPPLPAHAIEQIEKAARERAAGIIHDGQYRPDNEGQYNQARRQPQQQQQFRQPQQQQQFRQPQQQFRQPQQQFRQPQQQFGQPQQQFGQPQQQFNRQSSRRSGGQQRYYN